MIGCKHCGKAFITIASWELHACGGAVEKLKARLAASESVERAVILQLCDVAAILDVPKALADNPPALVRETATRLLALRDRVRKLERVAQLSATYLRQWDEGETLTSTRDELRAALAALEAP